MRLGLETRPRNQGLLTAWELKQHGVPHTVIADNAAGLLLMRGEVDAVIVGATASRRMATSPTRSAPISKALAAKEAGVPFHVAAPRSTLDFACPSGEAIPIEEREGDELRIVNGKHENGEEGSIRQLAADEAVANPAFDDAEPLRHRHHHRAGPLPARRIALALPGRPWLTSARN